MTTRKSLATVVAAFCMLGLSCSRAPSNKSTVPSSGAGGGGGSSHVDGGSGATGTGGKAGSRSNTGGAGDQVKVGVPPNTGGAGGKGSGGAPGGGRGGSNPEGGRGGAGGAAGGGGNASLCGECPSATCCDGVCTDLSESHNCGACGNVCQQDAPVCLGHFCFQPDCPASCSGASCCGFECCGPGKLCCGVGGLSGNQIACLTPMGTGRCPPWQGSGGGTCNSPDTPIATPDGELAIATLVPGDLVYSLHHGALVAVPISIVHRVAVHNHHVVRLTLDNGAVLEISPGHPLPDGRTIGELLPGNGIDQAHVLRAERIPYQYSYTYDILPASDTASYVAGGVMIGSTLR